MSFATTGFSGFFVKTVSVPIPIKWLAINGNLNAQNQATINFKVQETNVANYTVEKSFTGINFTNIGSLVSNGNGTNNYNFTDVVSSNGTAYYRLKQTCNNGNVAYSTIIKLSASNTQKLTIYPNPVKNIATISGATIGTKLLLTDISGKLLQQFCADQTTFTIDSSKYTNGFYILKANNGTTLKLLKQ